MTKVLQDNTQVRFWSREADAPRNNPGGVRAISEAIDGTASSDEINFYMLPQYLGRMIWDVSWSSLMMSVGMQGVRQGSSAYIRRQPLALLHAGEPKSNDHVAPPSSEG